MRWATTTLFFCCILIVRCQLADAANPDWQPRNFDSVYPRGDLEADAFAAHVAPYSVVSGVRPWYLSPYRNYSFYRPWYTYGAYGPIWYRYHYAPSTGYRQPWYGPHYLNPDAIASPPTVVEELPPQ